MAKGFAEGECFSVLMSVTSNIPALKIEPRGTLSGTQACVVPDTYVARHGGRMLSVPCVLTAKGEGAMGPLVISIIIVFVGVAAAVSLITAVRSPGSLDFPTIRGPCTGARIITRCVSRDGMNRAWPCRQVNRHAPGGNSSRTP